MDIRKINIFFIIRRTLLILLVLTLLAVGLFWGGTALIVHRLQRVLLTHRSGQRRKPPTPSGSWYYFRKLIDF